MERIAAEIHAAEGLIADPAAFFIAFGVEPSRERQTGFRFRIPDEGDDGHAVEPRAASLMLGNEAEHAMLDLIPLARAGGKRRDVDREVQCIGEPLQFGFPQAHATPVPAAPIRCNIELRGLFV